MTWQFANVDSDVLLEKEITSWPFKVDKPDVLYLFTDFPFGFKRMGPWEPSHMTLIISLLGKSICWAISVRYLTHMLHLLF